MKNKGWGIYNSISYLSHQLHSRFGKSCLSFSKFFLGANLAHSKTLKFGIDARYSRFLSIRLIEDINNASRPFKPASGFSEFIFLVVYMPPSTPRAFK